MPKGRKNGCPVNIRNWIVSVLDVSEDEFIRIYGLNSMTRSTDADTEDGSSDTDTWGEPYVTKRNGSVSLEGRAVVVESTGAKDPGQEILDSHAELSGCDGDVTLKFVDPYGHGWIADYIVTSSEISADDTGTTKSWELEQVGEAESIPYVQVTSIALKDNTADASTLSLEIGDPPKIITVAFTPENASNKRFKVANNRRSVCTVSNITEDGFTVTPVSVGTANITVTSINGEKTASCTVTVSAAAG